jgi:hypothetical protein
MWIACFNWIVAADETKLACASDLHRLIREKFSHLLVFCQLPQVHGREVLGELIRCGIIVRAPSRAVGWYAIGPARDAQSLAGSH